MLYLYISNMPLFKILTKTKRTRLTAPLVEKAITVLHLAKMFSNQTGKSGSNNTIRWLLRSWSRIFNELHEPAYIEVNVVHSRIYSHKTILHFLVHFKKKLKIKINFLK